VLPVLFAHEGRRPIGRLVPMVLLLILVVGVMSVLARGNLDFVVQRARTLEAGGLQQGNAGGRVHMLGRTARSVDAYDLHSAWASPRPEAGDGRLDEHRRSSA